MHPQPRDSASGPGERKPAGITDPTPGAGTAGPRHRRPPERSKPHGGGAFARRAAWLVAVALAGSVPAAAQDGADRWRMVDEWAREVLREVRPSPADAIGRLRGEACLWLAVRGDRAVHAAVLGVLDDPSPAARARALIALGRLGAPGAAMAIDAAFARAVPGSLVQQAAALAAGVLPDDVVGPRIERWLADSIGSGHRRDRATMAAFLAGTTLRLRTPERRTELLRALHEDPSNRDPDLHALLRTCRARLPHAERIPPDAEHLRAAGIGARAATLRDWPAGDEAPSPADVRAVARLALRDRAAAVRAEALRLLARWRVDEALPLAQTALRSDEVEEAAAGADVVTALLGPPGRDMIEAAITERGTRTPAAAALLDRLPPPHSPELMISCLETLQDETAPGAARVATGMALAAAGSQLALDALDRLLLEVDDPAAATRMLAAASDRPVLARLLERVRRCESSDDVRRLPARVRALAAADVNGLPEVFVDLVTGRRLAPGEQATALAALRTGREGEPAATVTDHLAPELARVLRGEEP